MKNKNIEEILIQRILPFVNKPGRYIGNEINAITKDPEQTSIRVALAFPEVYELAMSYVGFDILYHVLNKNASIWAERVYAPWTDMEALVRENDVPLYSLESFTPLSEFDIIGFTLQYELTYTNVLNMLDLSGIPLFAKDREESTPIIVGGGPCGCNPEPMADFFDAFVIGDGEESFVEVCNVYDTARKSGKNREESLFELSKLRGVYVPGFYQPQYNSENNFSGMNRIRTDVPEKILNNILPELREEYYPDKPLVPLIEVTHDRLSVEVMRGCTEGCRYCNAGMIYRPTRERNHGKIVDYIEKSIESSGYEEVSFLSLSISDYSQLNNLMREEKERLAGSGVNVSFPSMRLDSFSEEIAEFVASVRKSGFTFAPEAGSERLRRVINKNITEDDLYQSVEIALRNGWKQLKFYFMIGLPTETKEDVEAIAVLIENVVRMSKQFGKVRFNVSVSPFSPKAHTPFQWEQQNTREEFIQKTEILRNRFSRIRNVQFNWRDPEVSLIECVLGRGDRRMAQAIYKAWENGAKFDGWTDLFNFQMWKEVFEQQGLSLDKYSGELPTEKPLPWDHIDKGVSKQFLLQERQNAFDEITIDDCKDGKCFACGIQRKDSFAQLADCYKQMPVQGLSDRLKDKHVEKSMPVQGPERKANAEEARGRYYRIQFTKQDYTRFLSHLDIVRIFNRACRRASIPIRYTQGFNPHPKMIFSPPLSLGVSSSAEYLDLEISPDYNGDLQNELNPLLPEGLKVTQVSQSESKYPIALSSINQFEYCLETANGGIDEEKFNQSLSRLLSSEKIEVDRNVKGQFKKVNIRPYIDSIALEGKKIAVKTRSIQNRSVRISEVISELFKDIDPSAWPVLVHREAQNIQTEHDLRSPFGILS